MSGLSYFLSQVNLLFPPPIIDIAFTDFKAFLSFNRVLKALSNNLKSANSIFNITF